MKEKMEEEEEVYCVSHGVLLSVPMFSALS